MAFSFTLPELRAELRALGHGGLPDHLILNFLSQLDLPIPTPENPNSPSLRRPYPASPFSSPSSSPSPSSSSLYGLETSSSCSDFSCHSRENLLQACSGFTELECKRKFERLAGVESEEVVGNNGRHGRVPRGDRFLFNALPQIGDGRKRISKEDHKETRKQKRNLRREKMIEDKEERRDHQIRNLSAEKMITEEEVGKGKSRQKRSSRAENMLEHYWISVGDEYIRSMEGKVLNANERKTCDGGEEKGEFGDGILMMQKTEKPVDVKSSRYGRQRGILMQNEMEKHGADMKCGSLMQKMMEEPCADMKHGNLMQKEMEKPCADMKLGSLMQKETYKPCADMKCGSLMQRMMKKPCADMDSGKKGNEHGNVREKIVKFLDTKISKNDQNSAFLIEMPKKSMIVKSGKKKEDAKCGEFAEKVQDCRDELKKLTLSLPKKPWHLETNKKDRSVTESKKLEAMPTQSAVPTVSGTSMAMSETAEDSHTSSSSSSFSSSSSAPTEMASIMSQANHGDEVSEEIAVRVVECGKDENCSTKACIDEECETNKSRREPCVHECQAEAMASMELSKNDTALSASPIQIQGFQNPNNATPPSQRELLTQNPNNHLYHYSNGFSDSSPTNCQRLVEVKEKMDSITIRERHEVGSEARCDDIYGKNGFDYSTHAEEEVCSFLDPSVCSKSSSGSNLHSRFSRGTMSSVSQKASTGLSPSRKHQQNSHKQRRRGGKIDRVERFAEMQKLWRKDSFLVSNDQGGKRKGIPSFHHVFSALHHDSCMIGIR